MPMTLHGRCPLTIHTRTFETTFLLFAMEQNAIDVFESVKELTVASKFLCSCAIKRGLSSLAPFYMDGNPIQMESTFPGIFSWDNLGLYRHVGALLRNKWQEFGSRSSTESRAFSAWWCRCYGCSYERPLRIESLDLIHYTETDEVSFQHPSASSMHSSMSLIRHSPKTTGGQCTLPEKNLDVWE